MNSHRHEQRWNGKFQKPITTTMTFSMSTSLDELYHVSTCQVLVQLLEYLSNYDQIPYLTQCIEVIDDAVYKLQLRLTLTIIFCTF